MAFHPEIIFLLLNPEILSSLTWEQHGRGHCCCCFRSWWQIETSRRWWHAVGCSIFIYHHFDIFIRYNTPLFSHVINFISALTVESWTDSGFLWALVFLSCLFFSNSVRQRLAATRWWNGGPLHSLYHELRASSIFHMLYFHLNFLGLLLFFSLLCASPAGGCNICWTEWNFYVSSFGPCFFM